MNQFEIQYDIFCMKDKEENVFFDYTGVNAEGSTPNSPLRTSWAHLLLLDGVLSYTELKEKVSDMSHSKAFLYHKVLRTCVQTAKLEYKLTRRIESDMVPVDIPRNWTSLRALQESLCLDDTTVSDIFDFLASSPLFDTHGHLVKLITEMVNEIPLNDAPNSNIGSEKNNNMSVDKSNPESKTLSEVKVKVESKPVVINNAKVDWNEIASVFTNQCDSYLSQGHNKILLDLCDVSTHCSPATLTDWRDLLLLDALSVVLLDVLPKKRTSTCFNQHRVLRESIQAVVVDQIPINTVLPRIPPSTLGSSNNPRNSKVQRQALLDMAAVDFVVSHPWDNILNFQDEFCAADATVVDPSVIRRNVRKMSFKRHLARMKAGQTYCDSHIFEHLSLKSVIIKVRNTNF